MSRTVDAIEVAAGIDQRDELRPGDRQTWSDGLDAPGLLLEVPDELAACAFPRKAPSVLGEDGNVRPNSVRLGTGRRSIG